MTSRFRHRSVRGGLRADRERLISAMDLPPRLMDTVDAHARLRGPYTAGGAIVREVTEAHCSRSGARTPSRHRDPGISS